METILILNIDRKSIADMLFVQRIGRFLGPCLRPGRRVIVVHDGFDAAEDVLDMMGHDMDAVSDPAVAGEVAPKVFAAVRDRTRRIVAALTDEGIPAAGMQGADRGLVVQTPDGLQCEGVNSLAAMTGIGTVPIVGPIVGLGPKSLALADSLSLSIAIAQRIATLEGADVPALVVFRPEILDEVVKHSSKPLKTDVYGAGEVRNAAICIQPNELANTEFWERFT